MAFLDISMTVYSRGFWHFKA